MTRWCGSSPPGIDGDASHCGRREDRERRDARRQHGPARRERRHIHPPVKARTRPIATTTHERQDAPVQVRNAEGPESAATARGRAQRRDRDSGRAAAIVRPPEAPARARRRRSPPRRPRTQRENAQPRAGERARGDAPVKAMAPNDRKAASSVPAAAAIAARRDDDTGARMTGNSTCRSRPAPSRARARSFWFPWPASRLRC